MWKFYFHHNRDVYRMLPLKSKILFLLKFSDWWLKRLEVTGLGYNVGEGVQDLYAHNCWRGDSPLIFHFHFTLLLQYKIGQLYMIAKHSAEQSQKGEGVEVVENRPHSDPVRPITVLAGLLPLNSFISGPWWWSIHREENLHLKVRWPNLC